MRVACHDGAFSVAIGARHIDDDALGLVVARVCFAGDSAVGGEELVGDVGEYGGAAWGDTAFGDESEKGGEELVDVDAGVEFGAVWEEVRGKVLRVGVDGQRNRGSGECL